MARRTRVSTGIVVGLLAALFFLGACTPRQWTRPGTTQARFAADDAACEFEALTTPPSYQAGLPEYGYGYPYGRSASAGDGIGLMLAVGIERLGTKAWQSEVKKRCLIALGYQEVR